MYAAAKALGQQVRKMMLGIERKKQQQQQQQQPQPSQAADTFANAQHKTSEVQKPPLKRGKVGSDESDTILIWYSCFD